MSEDPDYRSDSESAGDYSRVPISEPAEFYSPISITSYGLNHPKSYIAYAVALSEAGDREGAVARLQDGIIDATDEARRGAQHLDLIAPITDPNRRNPDGSLPYRLTDRGRLVVGKAVDAYGSRREALETFRDLKRSQTQFSQTDEVWQTVGPCIALADPTVAYFVPLMQALHEDTGRDSFYLGELTHYYLPDHDLDFTVEFFFIDRQVVRDKVKATYQDQTYDVFSTPGPYRSTVTYQLKTILFHLGVLTERGVDSVDLDPKSDVWELTDRLR